MDAASSVTPAAMSAGPAVHNLTPHEARVIAVRAGCDPRTVIARFTGKKNQPSTVVARIDAAAKELGFTLPPSAV
jgi:hypothetical protein